MTTLLHEQKRFLASTITEAEKMIDDVKQQSGTLVKHHAITRKFKKDVEYFLVNVTLEYYSVNDLVITD